MTPTTPGQVNLDSTTLAAVAYDDRRGELKLDFRDELATRFPGSRRNCFATCSVLLPRAPSLTDTFEAASLMPNYRLTTKWHWAEARGRF
jgi:hypothetical protein